MPLKIKEEFRFARSCYKHLAGIIGIEITSVLVSKNCLQKIDNHFILTKEGEIFFRGLGIKTSVLETHSHKTSNICIDGTEKRPHLAGYLGKLLLDFLITQKWVIRKEKSRIL